MGRAPGEVGRVRIGCQANAWQRAFAVQERLGEVLAQMAAAGYEGAELPVWSIPDQQEPGYVRDLLAQQRLTLISIHIGGTFHERGAFQEQTLPAARQAATCAAAAGAEGMVVSAAVKPRSGSTPGALGAHGRKTAAELRIQAEQLDELAQIHQALGLVTYYHNHVAELEYGQEELRSILEVDSSRLALCFDIEHAARVLPGPALLEVMDRYWSRIGYLHYRDAKDGTVVEAVGDGDLDFAAMGARMHERGFCGWAVAEIPQVRGMIAARSVFDDAQLSCAAIRRSLSAERGSAAAL